MYPSAGMHAHTNQLASVSRSFVGDNPFSQQSSYQSCQARVGQAVTITVPHCCSCTLCTRTKPTMRHECSSTLIKWGSMRLCPDGDVVYNLCVRAVNLSCCQSRLQSRVKLGVRLQNNCRCRISYEKKLVTLPPKPAGLRAVHILARTG
jgi:hypothetical protein